MSRRNESNPRLIAGAILATLSMLEGAKTQPTPAPSISHTHDIAARIAADPYQRAVKALAPLELPTGAGAWFGVSVDFNYWNISAYQQETGLQPVVYNVFVQIPLSPLNRTYLNTVLYEVAEAGAALLITAEPWLGLDAVDNAAVAQLAATIAQWEKLGAAVLVRFAHEMNGNWYPWGQQPSAYIAAFQRVAAGLRAATCSAGLVWAPNGPEGYPWPGGPYPPSASALRVMDTNGDGLVDDRDDMYTPFYPGDEVVDWVGMSVDHLGGTNAPYLRNMRPGPREFTTKITGGVTAAGHETPNFYALFCGAASAHTKPLVVTETAAMYLPQADPWGDSQTAIKRGWWQQAFNVWGDTEEALDLRVHFPNLKMILWFDEIKREDISNGSVVDWRISADPSLRMAFTEYVTAPLNGSSAAADAPLRHWQFLPSYQAHRTALVAQGRGTCHAAAAPSVGDAASQLPLPQAAVATPATTSGPGRPANGVLGGQQQPPLDSAQVLYRGAAWNIDPAAYFNQWLPRTTMHGGT